MKCLLKIALLSVMLPVFAACGGDDQYDPVKQQEDFEKFFESNQIDYDTRLAREFIYRVTLPDEDYVDWIRQFMADDAPAGTEEEPLGEVVQTGDRIVIFYAGHFFSSSAVTSYGRAGMFTTNITDYSQSIGWYENPNTEPLEITVGDFRLEGLNRGIPGSRVGTGFLLYLSADFAYGEGNQIGIVDPIVPVIYEIYILEKITE